MTRLAFLIVIFVISGLAQGCGKKAIRPEVSAYLDAVENVLREGKALIKTAEPPHLSSAISYEKQHNQFRNAYSRIPSPPDTWEDFHQHVKSLARSFEQTEDIFKDLLRVRPEIARLSDANVKAGLRNIEAALDSQSQHIRDMEAAIAKVRP